MLREIRRCFVGLFVLTILSIQGCSGGKTNVYTEENMKTCGYALRNWIDFLAVREVYFRVIAPVE